MDSHNIFVFHLKFGGFEETHFCNKNRTKIEEKEKQCVGKHDQHSSNPILLIPTISSFSIWNLEVLRNTCWTKKSARQHTKTWREREREGEGERETMCWNTWWTFFQPHSFSSHSFFILHLKFGGFKTHHMFWSNLLCCCCQMRGSRMYHKKLYKLRRVYKDLLWIWKKVHIKLHHVKHNPKFIDCSFLWFLWSNVVFMIQLLINPWVCMHIDMYGTEPRFPPPWTSLRFLVMKSILMALVQVCIHCLVTRNWKN